MIIVMKRYCSIFFESLIISFVFILFLNYTFLSSPSGYRSNIILKNYYQDNSHNSDIHICTSPVDFDEDGNDELQDNFQNKNIYEDIHLKALYSLQNCIDSIYFTSYNNPTLQLKSFTSFLKVFRIWSFFWKILGLIFKNLIPSPWYYLPNKSLL